MTGIEPEDTDDELEEQEGDSYLAVFVRLANMGSAQMGVTLLVGGTLVSGNLVSGADWHKAFAEQASGEADERDENLREMLSKPAARYEDMPEHAPITYIHLSDARLYGTDGSFTPMSGTWWRGRIDRVDGWFLGRLTRNT